MARVEKRTFICSHTRGGAKPTPHEGIKSKLGHWMHPDEMDAKLEKDFAGCMEGPFLLLSTFLTVYLEVEGLIMSGVFIFTFYLKVV